jgi:hypothetical protein
LGRKRGRGRDEMKRKVGRGRDRKGGGKVRKIKE